MSNDPKPTDDPLIEKEATRLGLSLKAYQIAIDAVRAGRMTPARLETIGKIFRRDEEILRELAK